MIVVKDIADVPYSQPRKQPEVVADIPVENRCNRLMTGANLRVELWLLRLCSISANEKITSRPDVVYVFDWPDAVIAMNTIEHRRIEMRFIN